MKKLLVLFFILLILTVFLSFVINYLYIKHDKFGDYSQIIITGLISFIPFIPLSTQKIKFRHCFVLFFTTANITFTPMFLTGVNDIIKTSIIFYTLLLSIVFCRNKNKFKGAR